MSLFDVSRWSLRAFAGLVLACALPAHAQIYTGTNDSGAVVLSNFQTNETPDVVVEGPAVAASVLPVTSAMVTPAPDARPAVRLAPMIEMVAQETSISPHLLHAVISVESGYDANAVSRKGAQGLMQLMPQTAQRFGVHNALDPADNVRGGARYLKWLLDYFNGDLRLVLAAYNAGEIEVVKAGYRIPPFKETRDYVPKVLARINLPLPS